MTTVRAGDGCAVSPFLECLVEDVIAGIGGVGGASGKLLYKELEDFTEFPVPLHVGVHAFAFTPETTGNRLWIGRSDGGAQGVGSIPNRKDVPAFCRRNVLDAAITTGRLTGMPVRAAIVHTRMSGQDGDFTVQTSRIALLFEVPPEMLAAN